MPKQRTRPTANLDPSSARHLRRDAVFADIDLLKEKIMFRILNGLAASLVLGGVLAAASTGLAQDKSTSQPQGSMGGMMPSGTMMQGGTSGMSSDDMQKMMARCPEMMKGDSTPG